MTQTTEERQQVETLIRELLFTVSGTHSPSAQVLEWYRRALKNFTFDQIETAIGELIETTTGHIGPGMIHNQVLGVSQADAADAWDFYTRRVIRQGVNGTRSTAHSDPRAQRALLAIGGAAGMNVEVYDLPPVRAAFIRAFYEKPEKKKKRR